MSGSGVWGHLFKVKNGLFRPFLASIRLVTGLKICPGGQIFGEKWSLVAGLRPARTKSFGFCASS